MSKITRRCGVQDIAPSTHLAFSRPNPSTLPSWVSTSVSNRLMVLVLAAGLSMPRRRSHASSDRRTDRSALVSSIARQTTVITDLRRRHQCCSAGYARPDSPAVHCQPVIRQSQVHRPTGGKVSVRRLRLTRRWNSNRTSACHVDRCVGDGASHPLGAPCFVGTFSISKAITH